MKEKIKKLLSLALIFCLIISLVACGKEDDDDDDDDRSSKTYTEKVTKEVTSEPTEVVESTPTPTLGPVMVKLPDVSGTDFDSAKAVLINKGFLIIVEEDYSDTVKPGTVIGTNPKGETMLEENSKVVLSVSKGPRLITAKDANVSWQHIDPNKPDEWSFGAPQIFEDMLYIHCCPIFGTEFTFKNSGFGVASITDSFDKKAPLTIVDGNLKNLPENKLVKKGEEIEIYLRIPLAQLDSDRPTHIACEIPIFVGNQTNNINVEFNMSW